MKYHTLQRIAPKVYVLVYPDGGETGHSVEKIGNYWVGLNMDDEEYCKAKTKRECFELLDELLTLDD